MGFHDELKESAFQPPLPPGAMYMNSDPSSERDEADSDGEYGDVSRSDMSHTGTNAFDDTPEAKSGYDVLKSKGDTERIRMFRILVAGMLIMTGVVTGIAYYLLGKQEEENFETAYNQFARTLADAAVNQQRSLRDSMKSLGTEITGYAQANNQMWPFVVLPLFEAYAKGYFDHSAGEYVGINNIVEHKYREEYITWTTEHYQDWIFESHLLQFGNPSNLDTDPTKYNPFISKKDADGNFVPDHERDYYSVRSVESPPMRAFGPLMNLNIGSLGTVEGLVKGMIEMRNETMVTSIQPYSALSDEAHAGFHSDEEGEAVDHPHSFLYQPIYERVHDTNSKIVAMVNAAVAWDASMRNLLPETVHGIHCVIRNNCDQVFTYEVDGPEAHFMGRVDAHDSKYDSMKVEVSLDMHTHPNFTATPHHCIYTMDIYPTDSFKADYTTSLPLMFTIIVGASFSCVALIFLGYDLLVRYRNQELADNAAKSNKLVASLFPGEIKDRLLEAQEVSKKRLKFQAQNPAIDNTRPLAMSYEATTVMFADLKGFTAWSSNRTPVEVFELLEAIYSAFDQIGRTRRVFKVETIGDCYVAATGLPEPQQDHVIRMCRFSNACMKKMDILLAGLAESLGKDTTDLCLRVGLHSGSVTGGVLRGDKSRFQLFGDTMNTASRMESNGVPGKIHVSQTTADELTAAGKGSWLTARPDKIVAKGKGEMDTYFVTVPEHTDRSARSGNTDDSASIMMSNHTTNEASETKAF